MQNDRATALDGRWLAWGLILGLLGGVGLALWFAPHSGPSFRNWVKQNAGSAASRAKQGIEQAAPVDPVAQSLAEGKEAARKRREGVVS
jgi:hypothetical protein